MRRPLYSFIIDPDSLERAIEAARAQGLVPRGIIPVDLFGLPADYESACDLRVTMPMRGRADSLNAAVAGAVLAYEVLASLERGDS